MPPTPRILPLETLRGLAAIVVAVGHFLIGFRPVWHGAPAYSGHLPERFVPDGWIGSPFFFLVNASGAVCLFFALSGFVLTARHVAEPRSRRIVDALLRRYLRLVIPITASVLASGALFWLGAQHHQEASTFTHSRWLGTFMFGHLGQVYRPGLGELLVHAFWEVPFLGAYQLNSVLWTMQLELYGSFFVLATCFLLFLPAGRFLAGLTLVAGAAAAIVLDARYLPFPAGMALALLPAPKALGLPGFLALVVPGLACLGYFAPLGFYEPLAAFDRAEDEVGRYALWTIGSAMMITAFRCPGPIADLCSGAPARWLGRLSFPIYLTHTLVITSLASWIYVELAGRVSGEIQLLATSSAFALATLLASLAFVPFDRIGVRAAQGFSAFVLARFPSAR